MRLYWDLDSNSFIQSSFSTVAQRSQTMVRSSSFPIELQYIRAGLPVLLGTGSESIGCVIKEPTKYDGDSLIPTPVWTRNATDKVYTANFNFITTALDALFAVDADPTNDVASLSLTLGLGYSLDGGTTWTPSPSLPLTLSNNKYRGTEASAAILSSGVFTPFIATALSGGAADNLDGIVTVGMSVPKVISMIIGNLLQFWQLKSSTAATATDVQQPADYATTTNEKVWFRLI